MVSASLEKVQVNLLRTVCLWWAEYFNPDFILFYQHAISRTQLISFQRSCQREVYYLDDFALTTDELD